PRRGVLRPRPQRRRGGELREVPQERASVAAGDDGQRGPRAVQGAGEQARRGAGAVPATGAEDGRLLSRSRAVGRGARVREEGRQEEGGRAAQGAGGQDADVAAQGRGADPDRAARGDVKKQAFLFGLIGGLAAAATATAAAGCGGAAVPGVAKDAFIAPVDVLQVKWRRHLTEEPLIEYKPQEFASAASDGARVYVGSSGKALWAFSARDGAIVWKR